MKIVCNGSCMELADGATVQDLTLKLSLEVRGLAIAVNDAVVSRARWESHILQANDRVTLIRMAQGG